MKDLAGVFVEFFAVCVAVGCMFGVVKFLAWIF